VRHIRCPTCQTRIPLYHEGPQEVVCPGCGRRGPYRPREPAAQLRTPGRAADGAEGAPPPAANEPESGLRVIRCSGCGSRVPIQAASYPVKVTCPSCGRSGTYRGPRV
ncbi:MAG: hypothetical protein ACUVV6_09160, partial [Thermoplasmatota archaeon]